MTTPELENQLRDALRRRAAAAPRPPVDLLEAPSPSAPRRVVAVAVAAAVFTAVAGLAVATGRDDGVPTVAADAPSPAAGDASRAERAGRADPAPAVPRLGFDAPAFRYERVEDCSGGPRPAPDADGGDGGGGSGPSLQTFGRSYVESPLLFVHTVEAAHRQRFGLVQADFGEPFTARGATGYAARDRAGRGWSLSVELPDGRAIYTIVIGLDLADVVPVLDGLQPRDAGGWHAPVLPPGMAELPPSTSWRGCGWSAVGDLPDDTAGAFEVNLYDDPFDGRLADRASSTVGTIEAVTIDGVPAAVGDYAADDHWVMFEPEPGRTVEIRASAMTREQALELARRARLVDEQAWQAMRPAR